MHPTHYGRICPIETPEGPNIGLINSLATFARVNKYGFIESPYRKVVERQGHQGRCLSVGDRGVEISYCPGQCEILAKGEFEEELIVCRHAGDVHMVSADRVDFVDVSPKQLVSVAAALIPFLENDDANRALMGSNMQRQAVPLVRPKRRWWAPAWKRLWRAIPGQRLLPGELVLSTRSIQTVSSSVQPRKPTRSKSGVDIFNLQKFQRSNQNTCINQRPLVRINDRVEAGDIIADGPSTDLGDLALGRNVLVAFMPWHGYNFEDSILVSERMVRDDVFTSIHIEEFEVMARDTKLGPEEITRDIPNVGEEALKNLDEAGIVYIGAEVNPGDILVGKITPKGESPMTPEEKLLRAIFGEKASDVRDTSLKLPPGVPARWSRFGCSTVTASTRTSVRWQSSVRKSNVSPRTAMTNWRFSTVTAYGRLSDFLLGKLASGGPKGVKLDGKITQAILDEVPRSQWWQIALKAEKALGELEAMRAQYDEAKSRLEQRFVDKVDKLQRGDELPPGVMKMVKVFVAVKRKIQPGDKMAGRHGNKGVISKIIPVEDMPYLEDGTPVDVVLNPLGVPSRMNVGQILETHLGWACHGLGNQIREAVEFLHGKQQGQAPA